jgi:hypothetical protein
MDRGAVRGWHPPAHPYRGVDLMGRDGPHEDDKRPLQTPGRAAFPVRHVRGDVSCLFDVPERDSDLSKRSFEGEAAPDEKGNKIFEPAVGDLRGLVDELAVLPDLVSGQISAQIRSGRENRRRAVRIGDVQNWTRLGIALGEQQDVISPVPRCLVTRSGTARRGTTRTR